MQTPPTNDEETPRQELVAKMQAGREKLSAALSGAPAARPVLSNGWTARDWLVHLAGWEQRIADAYQALAAGVAPAWDLDRMSLDEVNALIMDQAGEISLPEARAAEERAYRRLLEIARGAPAADLFDPARFAWMKSVPFAQWVEDNSCGHIEEHLMDWVGREEMGHGKNKPSTNEETNERI